MEVQPFNVHVTLVEPRGVSNGFHGQEAARSGGCGGCDGCRLPRDLRADNYRRCKVRGGCSEGSSRGRSGGRILEDPAPKIRYPIGSPDEIAYVTADLLSQAEVVKAAGPQD